jgi:hypothetical protein
MDGANDYPDAIETDDDIVNAFLADPEGDEDASKRKPSDKGADEDEGKTSEDKDEQANEDEVNDDQDPEETPGEDDEDDESEGTEDKTKEKKFADDSDETYVKVKVGDEEHEVPVKDLKRLWGQEAALTRNSQEVAEQRKTVEADRAKNIAAYDVMLKRTTERADAYRALPWTQLLKDPEVPADQLTALQAEAQKAYDEEAFIKNELDGFMKKVTEDQRTERVKAAKTCITSLTNPESPTYIKGWSNALYNDIRSFGTEMGIDKDTVNSLTDPGAFKILHMAMQFHRGAAKVVTRKVNKTPTRIVKNSASAPAARSTAKTVTTKTAVAKAKKSGSMEDAANAFLAMDGED